MALVPEKTAQAPPATAAKPNIVATILEFVRTKLLCCIFPPARTAKSVATVPPPSDAARSEKAAGGPGHQPNVLASSVLVTQVLPQKDVQFRGPYPPFACLSAEEKSSMDLAQYLPLALPGRTLLPPQMDGAKPCLVLDLDETLVHSSFQYVHDADYVVPIDLGTQVQPVYVLKRPGVDHFLETLALHYELVVFTASLSKYADAVLDLLDPRGLVAHRLFREHCVMYNGSYVKNMSILGRPLERSAILDNSHLSYLFDIENAVPVLSWFDDPADTELAHLLPMLVAMASSRLSVPEFLRAQNVFGDAPE